MTQAAPAAAASPVAAAPEAPVLRFEAFDDKKFIEARRSGGPVVLLFEADWCSPCKKMHAVTYRAPAVLEAAAGSRLFRVDMTRPDAYVELVQKSFHVTGAPTVIFFGTDGKERQRRFGFIPPETFAEMLSEGRKPVPSNEQNHP